MRAADRTTPLILTMLLLGGAGQVMAEGARAGVAGVAGVGGRVLTESAPLPAAGVYVYQLADLSLHKVLTDPQGNFLFQDLPAGLYKIIAHKPGFVPVVVMLTRTTAQTYQFVELQLSERSGLIPGAREDFWSVRSRIPSDVLRQIDAAELKVAGLYSSDSGTALSLAGMSTEMQAMTGVDQISAEDGQVSGGGLGFKGSLGPVKVGLRGSFWQLSGNPAPQAGPVADGQASRLSLDLSAGPASRISLMSVNNRLVLRDDSGVEPVDYSHYQVNWSQDVGDKGRSDFAAQYTAESNFHRQGTIGPLDIPEASRTWKVEGAYTMSLGDRNTLQTGLRYRERQFGMSASSLRPEDQPASASIDLFGHGGVRVQPAVLLEYGLYSTLADGSLSLMPQGGVVLQPRLQLAGSRPRAASGSMRTCASARPSSPPCSPRAISASRGAKLATGSASPATTRTTTASPSRPPTGRWARRCASTSAKTCSTAWRASTSCAATSCPSCAWR